MFDFLIFLLCVGVGSFIGILLSSWSFLVFIKRKKHKYSLKTRKALKKLIPLIITEGEKNDTDFCISNSKNSKCLRSIKYDCCISAIGLALKKRYVSYDVYKLLVAFTKFVFVKETQNLRAFIYYEEMQEIFKEIGIIKEE